MAESIIQKYKASGTLVRWHDFRSGCIDDFTGNVTATFITTDGNPSLNREGLVCTKGQLRGVDSGTLNVGTNDFSVVALFKGNAYDLAYGLIRGDTGAGAILPMYIEVATGRPRLYLDGSAYSPASGATICDGKTHVLGLSADRSGNATWYLDGVLYGSIDISAAVAASISTDDLAIGCDTNTSSAGWPGTIGAALVFNNQLLTATEISQLTSELLAQKWPTKPKSKTVATSLIELSDSGLVGAWDMKPQGSTIVDLTTNKNGTLIGGVSSVKTILGDALEFDGTTGYVAIGDTSQTVQTVAFWVKGTTTTEDFMDLDGGTHTIEVAAGTITATGFDTPTIYIDGNADTTFTADTWHRIVVTTATGFSVSNLNLGKETIYLEGKMTAPEMWSDEKSSAWVSADYKKGASLVEYKTDWGVNVSVANVTSGQLENSDFWNTTGTHKIETDTHNGQLVKVINPVVGGTLTLRAETLNDDNWKMYVDTGSGYTLVESGMMASNVLTTTTGEKIILVDRTGNYSITKYLGVV